MDSLLTLRFFIFDNGADHSKIRGRSNSTILLGVTQLSLKSFCVWRLQNCCQEKISLSNRQ